MGLLDRDYIHSGKSIKNRIPKNNYTPEQPNTNGYVIPSLRNLKNVENIPKPNKKTVGDFHSPPKVEDKYKTEYVPKISPIQTQYKPKNNQTPKVKKPWWKFW